jgi:hypothetical protein
VSWTVLESTAFGCDVVFPNFRSFPEFIPENRLYRPFDVLDAIDTLEIYAKITRRNITLQRLQILDDKWKHILSLMICTQEINVWHELEYCKYLLKQQGYNE